MKVKPILENWEIKGIESISSSENRKLVEHSIPGKVGNAFQDLGSRPTEIIVSGSLHGDEIRDGFLQEVRNRYKAAQPVTFVADITTATDIQYVLIKDLQFSEIANNPDQFKYKIILNESPPPPPPADLLDAIDSDLLDQAQGLADTIANIADLADMLQDIPDFGDPTEPLKNSMEGVKAATTDLDSVVGNIKDIFGE